MTVLVRYLPSKKLVQIGLVCPCLAHSVHGSSMCSLFSCRTRKEASYPLNRPRLTICRRCSNVPVRRRRGWFRTSFVNDTLPTLVTSLLQKRLALIRIFAILCAVASVIIIASGFLRTIIHFMLKVRLCGAVPCRFD
jgi:hypothetical protein